MKMQKSFKKIVYGFAVVEANTKEECLAKLEDADFEWEHDNKAFYEFDNEFEIVDD